MRQREAKTHDASESAWFWWAAVIGVITALLVAAYAAVKDKKTAMGFERNMEDGEIMRRLARYARPYLSKFLIVGVLMLFSIAYDIISPLIVGRIEELVAGEFELRALFLGVSVYAGVLVFSMGSTYLQAVILQRVGQRIISDLREDLFSHIESLAHEQLNEIPVGKLVTRVTNDTNAISMMFTNLLVQLTKNSFVILGILVAMLCLNYELTLMVLCFVPFIVIFTVIFRKFSRRANRKLKNATTDINTYLSENLSGIKVTQIFGREDEKMEDFRQKSQKLARANQEQIFVFSVFRPLVYMLYVSSILCLFYLGGMGHLNNISFLGQTISSGTIVTFYMYISKFFTPIQNLAEQFNWLQSALASAEKVFSIMDIQPRMQDAPDAIELNEVKGEIEFRDVWFSYVPGEWVLQGVSFHVDAAPDRGLCRLHRLRQEHHPLPDLPELRVPEGPDPDRRHRHPQDQDLLPAQALRPDAAGCVPLLGHHPLQHRPAGGGHPRRARSWRSAATSTPTSSSTSWTTGWTRRCVSAATTSPPDSGSCSASPGPSSTSPA